MKRTTVLAALLLPLAAAAQETDLSGTWRFSLDREDKGIQENWQTKRLDDSINLPGSTISEGKGDPVCLETPWTASFPDRSFFTSDAYKPYREKDNFKVPFFLQPDTYYLGSAWYQRDIEIGEETAGKPLEIFFERCHWQSMLWLDGELIGKCNALSAPQRFTAPEGLPAGKHTLTVMVDNRIHDVNPGENAHSVSDHTQGNWNGIVGKMTMKAVPEKAIDSVTITPDFASGVLKVDMAVMNRGKAGKTTVTYRLFGKTEKREIQTAKGWTRMTESFPIPQGARLWSEFDPYLYPISIECGDDLWESSFGLRELKVDNGVLKINGKPAFMRGTLNCAQFPMTGYPATDKAEWIREFSICKAYGLNHIRFHSWCPPEAAFLAADEMGMYLYVECSAWAEIGVGKGIDKYIQEESERIIYEFGNHPSLCFFSYGNEPSGKATEYLKVFVDSWKARDARRLYTGGAGWPNMPECDFLSDMSPRIQIWGAGVKSVINAQRPSSTYDWSWYSEKTLPSQTYISHEIGQWCVYPRFGEIDEYTGPYKARNFEIFRETLEKNGMGHLADSFLLASGRLQTLCYKADIEAALRSKGQGGYHLLGLQDFSGQGTALVGALDAMWNEKGYTTAREYSEFQSPLVPLARMEKMVFMHGENFKADIELANYLKDLRDTEVCWSVTDMNGVRVKKGSFHKADYDMGNRMKVGTVEFAANELEGPLMYRFEVSVAGHVNRWNIWVYPDNRTCAHEGVIVTDTLDGATLKSLEDGAKVLLYVKKGHLSDEMGGDVQIGFSSIFWNTSWTNRQAPHTLGILCNPSDKALSQFPTDYCSDFQWWDAMSHSGALRLDRLGGRPVVRVIDDWFTNRPLALLSEGRVGKGKLMVSGIDFSDGMDSRPEGRQLLKSLTDYMSSSDFHPSEDIKIENIKKLWK